MSVFPDVPSEITNLSPAMTSVVNVVLDPMRLVEEALIVSVPVSVERCYNTSSPPKNVPLTPETLRISYALFLIEYV